MLFSFEGGATGYLGTFIATAECWRMQVFGSKGWAVVGSIPHLHTWSLTTCMVNAQPTVIDYPQGSTKRAELEAFADAIEGRAAYPISYPEMLDTIGAFEAVIEAANSGRAVSLQAASP